MVGDDNADVLVFQGCHDALYVFDGDRVDPGERFVEQDELRVDRHRPGDLGASSFAARKLDAEAFAHFGQPELFDQVFEPFLLILFREIGHLQDGPDVVLDRQSAEYRSFLSQVADPLLGAFVDRLVGQFLVFEENRTLVGLDQSDDHVERRGLAGAVRAEQSDDLPLVDFDRHMVDHRAGFIAFYQVFRV